MSHCYDCGAALSRGCPSGDNRVREHCLKCGYVHYDNPKNQVAVVLNNKDRLLWMRRAQEPRAGFWEIPGGFVEKGETLRQAAARETYEEAGIVLQPEQFTLYVVGGLEAVSEVHLLFRASVDDGQLASLRPGKEEVLELAWFTEEEAPWAELAYQQAERGLRLFYSELSSNTYGLYYAEQGVRALHLDKLAELND